MAPWDLDAVRLLIQEHVQERPDLEFKERLPESGRNDDLAKLICAMANSEGGTIIYGIAEDDQSRAAAQADPLVPLEGAADRVSLVARTLDEPVNILPLTIEEPSARASGYLVVDVPLSDRAPHFAPDGIAWGRAGRTTYKLRRRDIGERFARSSGFAEEFGLEHPAPPASVVVVFERALDRNYLVFQNIGQRPALNVRHEFDPPSQAVFFDDEGVFPLVRMLPGVPFRLPFISTSATPNPIRVRVRWEDEQGGEHDELSVVPW